MGRGFRWGFLAVAVAAGLFACGDSGDVDGTPSEDGGTQPLPGVDAGTNPDTDAGTDPGAADDGGAPDSGTPTPDAGPDAGTGTDGGTVFNPGPPLATPTLPNWQFLGRGQGGPTNVFGISSDQGGNIWVAGGADGLFLLTPGATTFRRITIADGLTPVKHPTKGNLQQKVMAVAGGKAGEVFVGYEGFKDEGGLGDIERMKEENLHKPENQWIVKSGDVDIVSLNGTTISVKHLDIFSPPGTFYEYGVPAHEEREKIFGIHRILYNPLNGDAYFGGAHGVAMWDGVNKRVDEHVHADINGYLEDGTYTLLSSGWRGVAVSPSGDLWISGANRTARVSLASTRDIEGGVKPPRPFIDIWTDAVQADSRPSERTDDNIYELSMNPDGSFWAGSYNRGLALVVPNADATPASITKNEDPYFITYGIASLERDPADGSLWLGHKYNGLTRRMPSGELVHYDFRVLGNAVTTTEAPDVQSDSFGGQRRILVAFRAGAIGIYTGP